MNAIEIDGRILTLLVAGLAVQTGIDVSVSWEDADDYTGAIVVECNVNYNASYMLAMPEEGNTEFVVFTDINREYDTGAWCMHEIHRSTSWQECAEVLLQRVIVDRMSAQQSYDVRNAQS